MILEDFKQLVFSKLDKMGLGKDAIYSQRLSEEFKIIKAQEGDYKVSIVDYFLNAATEAAKSGKVPNSNHLLVTYLMGISDEDPIKNNLEIIKTKSAEFPDIDMDFEDAKRDLVGEYVVQKYGRKNVANIAAYGRMQVKSVIKDISRVKNISLEEVNEITKKIRFDDTLDDIIEKPEIKKFFDKYSYMDLYGLCKKLNGNVRHISQHAAGLIIAPSDVMNYCGLERAKDSIITCFEEAGGSKELSKLGLVKMDLLGLNTLTVLHDAVDDVKKNHGVDVNIRNIDIYDPVLMAEFSKGSTIGVFQFERDWVRMMLRKLGNIQFSDIAVLNALNRPGPIEMGEKLWKTKAGQLPKTYLHPKLEPILSESYGTIVYQEQAMLIAQSLAGFSSDEADLFRKAMSSGKADLAKGFNPFEKYEKRFLDGCHKNGINERIIVTKTIADDKEMPATASDIKVNKETIDDNGNLSKEITCSIEVGDEIFYQIKKFAEYGFNKAHAVGYSQIAVQCMYLKHYYPMEYMASILSNTPNAVNQNDKSNKFIDYFYEAKRMKIKILPPNINASNAKFTPTKDSIISGFGFIKDLGDKAIEEIIKKRPFRSFTDFLQRVSGKEVNKSSIYALVHSGCFDDFIGASDDKTKLNRRYELINQYLTTRKLKDADIPVSPTTLDAIIIESDFCGEQIFNSILDLVDINSVNAKYSIDDKIVPISYLDKMNVKTTIRVMGIVNSFFVKRNPNDNNRGVGFLNLKNGSKSHRFIMWNKDVDEVDRRDDLRNILKPKTVISLKVRRERNYKDEKSFVITADEIEKLL